MNMKELGYRLLEDELFREKLEGIPKELYKDLEYRLDQDRKRYLRWANAIRNAAEKLQDGDVLSFAYMLKPGTGSKIVGGFTRHLDPVNIGYGFITIWI